MTPDDVVVGLIVAAFLIFGVVLFGVSVYVKLGERGSGVRATGRAAVTTGDRAAA